MCIDVVMSMMSRQVSMTKPIVIFQEKKVRDRNVAYMNLVKHFADLIQLHSLQKGGTH